jgi:hypothetical protein
VVSHHGHDKETGHGQQHGNDGVAGQQHGILHEVFPHDLSLLV